MSEGDFGGAISGSGIFNIEHSIFTNNKNANTNKYGGSAIHID